MIFQRFQPLSKFPFPPCTTLFITYECRNQPAGNLRDILIYLFQFSGSEAIYIVVVVRWVAVLSKNINFQK